jgi:hypothetical protein
MSLGKSLFVVSLGAAVVLSLGARRPAAATDFETRERARIQAHFDSVLGELRAVDLRALDASRREKRSELVAVLEAYRNRGVFPHNYDVPERPTPTFVDPRTGVRCAVANLVDYTGRGDIVTRVAAANNHVYVMELGADTAFTGWLDRHGITLAEAARIQMPYIVDESPMTLSGGPIDAMAVMLTGGSVVLGAANLLANSTGKHRVLSVAGIGVGAATTLAGIASISERSDTRLIGPMAITVGAMTAVLSASRMMRHGQETRNASAGGSRLQVTPSVDFAREAPARVGLQGRLRF